MIDLVGGASVQCHVRSGTVVPIEEIVQLLDHGGTSQGNEDHTSTPFLHGEDQSLQDRDASVLADSSEALGDSSRLTPVLSFAAVELFSLI